MRKISATFALVALCSTLVIGQQRGAAPVNPPATSGQPAPQAQAGPRGGGRGRGDVQVMTMSSSVWPDGGVIPGKYTQAGEDMSPPMQWSGAPDGVVSYVLVMHDADAAIGNGTDDILQWMLWNIPATVTALHEHAPSMAQLPDGTRQISATGPYYRGPGAPASGPTHHYVFELFALDAMLDVPAVSASPPATRAAIVCDGRTHSRQGGLRRAVQATVRLKSDTTGTTTERQPAALGAVQAVPAFP